MTIEFCKICGYTFPCKCLPKTRSRELPVDKNVSLAEEVKIIIALTMDKYGNDADEIISKLVTLHSNVGGDDLAELFNLKG